MLPFTPSPFETHITTESTKRDQPYDPESSGQLDDEEARSLLFQSFSRRTLRTVPSIDTLALESSGTETINSYLHELNRLIALAVPLIISNASSFLSSLLAIAFVGHVGKFELSAVILALSFFNVTGISFITGSLGALDTLCGQAYGAKNYPATGVALQRAVLFTTSLATGVALLWTQMERIMILFGQEPSLAVAAARFLRWNTPALFFLSFAECLKRYLMAQNIVLPSTIAAIATLIVTPIVNYILVSKLGWGLVGAAIAGDISQAVPCILLLVWIIHREISLAATSSPERTWYGWSKEALSDWGAYLRLAAPSAFMVCIEWWTFEACVLMAGWLDDPELQVAIMGLTLNVSGLLYMIPMSIGFATSVRVGNCLGAGLEHAARLSTTTALGFNVVLQAVLAICVVLTRHSLGYVFTDDSGVVGSSAPVFLLMAWCMQGDGINATLGGMLRGAGRQDFGALANLLAFWLIGLPLAGVLAFKAKMGVIGLWTGLAVCASTNVRCVLLYLYIYLGILLCCLLC